jgi:high-affinity Fe2+/Pb2+ permease
MRSQRSKRSIEMIERGFIYLISALFIFVSIVWFIKRKEESKIKVDESKLPIISLRARITLWITLALSVIGMVLSVLVLTDNLPFYKKFSRLQNEVAEMLCFLLYIGSIVILNVIIRKGLLAKGMLVMRERFLGILNQP